MLAGHGAGTGVRELRQRDSTERATGRAPGPIGAALPRPSGHDSRCDQDWLAHVLSAARGGRQLAQRWGLSRRRTQERAREIREYSAQPAPPGSHTPTRPWMRRNRSGPRLVLLVGEELASRSA